MGVSENKGPQYSTLNSRILLIVGGLRFEWFRVCGIEGLGFRVNGFERIGLIMGLLLV